MQPTQEHAFILAGEGQNFNGDSCTDDKLTGIRKGKRIKVGSKAEKNKIVLKASMIILIYARIIYVCTSKYEII